ncbi:MAG: exosortase/archaeosortase family protein [Smithella sp.]
MKIAQVEKLRHVIIIAAVLVATIIMYKPLTGLFASNLYRDYHSLIPFIPLISIYLLYLKRKEIWGKMQNSFGPGVAVTIVGLILFVVGMIYGNTLNQNDYATVQISSALIIFWGAFILAYGMKAFVVALFPLLFLIFMIPLPATVMEEIIVFLQKGSTEFANLLFLASGVPFVREGFVFNLPSQSIEVAPQCSGIRSGLALFITALLAGHLFLNTWWKKLLFVLFAVPVTMFKNGIRITTLALLSHYVDPRIIESPLHREGGIPFFIVGLLLMAVILFFLIKSEKRKASKL